jgi:hypothetical protein
MRMLVQICQTLDKVPTEVGKPSLLIRTSRHSTQAHTSQSASVTSQGQRAMLPNCQV